MKPRKDSASLSTQTHHHSHSTHHRILIDKANEMVFDSPGPSSRSFVGGFNPWGSSGRGSSGSRERDEYNMDGRKRELRDHFKVRLRAQHRRRFGFSLTVALSFSESDDPDSIDAYQPPHPHSPDHILLPRPPHLQPTTRLLCAQTSKSQQIPRPGFQIRRPTCLSSDSLPGSSHSRTPFGPHLPLFPKTSSSDPQRRALRLRPQAYFGARRFRDQGG